MMAFRQSVSIHSLEWHVTCICMDPWTLQLAFREHFKKNSQHEVALKSKERRNDRNSQHSDIRVDQQHKPSRQINEGEQHWEVAVVDCC